MTEICLRMMMLSVLWIYGTKECKRSRQNGALPSQNGPLKDSSASNASSTICIAVLPAEGVRFLTKEGKKPFKKLSSRIFHMLKRFK